MTFPDLISSLHQHGEKFPSEQDFCIQIIDWIQRYEEFAFVKDNLEGHLTGSMVITNPARTKVLLMLHKKFQRWQQFGGHCDGEIDARNVAIREFHEESGIDIEPEIIGDIFLVDIHDVPLDAKWRPPHYHFDLMYLGIIDESTPFSRQVAEVDDIRWFDIAGIEQFVESDMVKRIGKISTMWK